MRRLTPTCSSKSAQRRGSVPGLLWPTTEGRRYIGWGNSVSKAKEKIVLLIVDLIAINLAFLITFWIKYESGRWEYLYHLWMKYRTNAGAAMTFSFALKHYLWPAGVVNLYWLLLFGFYGLYKSWRAPSRLDELVAVGKIISLGALILFIPTFDPAHPFSRTRVVLFTYWLLLLLLVGTGRTVFRSMQRRALIRGFGGRRSVIVGTGHRGVELLRDLRTYPALGYHVVGFIREPDEEPQADVDGLPTLGTTDQLGQVAAEYNIEAVLIAISSASHEHVLDVIGQCNGHSVSFNIVPDLYDIVSGHARTNQIYGLPLMELLPELMPAWEQRAKRLMDVVFSLLVLVVFLPLWMIIALLIKLDSKGPILLRQLRVGKDGKLFTIYKFRSMVQEAEKYSGPVWAERNDPRITRVGRIIRRLRLDEIPQFINVLKGEMSLVGPRPERPFFVEQLEREIPLYRRRLRVAPGATGWAQVKQGYDTSLDDVREKLKYDLYYIENMSLRMDLKILLRTVFVALTGKGAH